MAAFDAMNNTISNEGEEDELANFLKQNANKLINTEKIYQELAELGIKLTDLLSFEETDLRTVLQSTNLNVLLIGRLFNVLKTTPQSAIYKQKQEKNLNIPKQQQHQVKPKIVILTKEEEKYMNKLNERKDFLKQLQSNCNMRVKSLSKNLTLQRKEIEKAFDELISMINDKKQSILNECTVRIESQESYLNDALKTIESNSKKLRECELQVHDIMRQSEDNTNTTAINIRSQRIICKIKDTMNNSGREIATDGFINGIDKVCKDEISIDLSLITSDITQTLDNFARLSVISKGQLNQLVQNEQKEEKQNDNGGCNLFNNGRDAMDARKAANHVGTCLESYYHKYILTLEQNYHFASFALPYLNHGDFMSKPMVLLIGQPSVNKAIFLRDLLECNVNTTADKFTALMHGRNECVVPGDAAVRDKNKPFGMLEGFGTSFLNDFQVREACSPILECITLINTPPRPRNKNASFFSVEQYWATRADRILLLLDGRKEKLNNISVEFHHVILALKEHWDKIRFVFDKSDQVIITQAQLKSLYISLLRSLGKVIETPVRFTQAKKMFCVEKRDLLTDLNGVQQQSKLKKIDHFTKRTRHAKVHALICETLRSQFGLFGKEKRQQELLHSMNATFHQVSSRYNVPMADFPNPLKFSQVMKSFVMWKFPPLTPDQVSSIDEVLTRGIPQLLSSGDWVVDGRMKQDFDSKFYRLSLMNDKASGPQVKAVMSEYSLSNQILAQIWELSDLDKDGAMTSEEFALCCYLCQMVKRGERLPNVLPPSYVPPSFRSK